MFINKNKKFSDFFTKSLQERKIDFLVLHHVEAESADHAIEQFFEHKVSSHFLIDESGEIFELVGEEDVAYHAGHSFWRGIDKINNNSIGIEFINNSPFSKEFEAAQMRSGVDLCRYLIDKYKISHCNIVGHSDIAYDPETGFLDRKQDPSHLFNWKFFAQNNIGIHPQIYLENDDNKLFSFENKDADIALIKKKFAKIGYKVANFSELFDEEMQLLARVFHRRYNQDKFNDDADSWYVSSQYILNELSAFYPN